MGNWVSTSSFLFWLWKQEKKFEFKISPIKTNSPSQNWNVFKLVPTCLRHISIYLW